jgi:hypothetical protein
MGLPFAVNQTMRIVVLAAVLLTCAPLASAQPPAKKPTTLTLDGCVAKSETATNLFTLTDGTDIYRLTGLDVRDYVGRRVQVATGAPRRLVIKGGLFPSPNVAAQAGAMDPSRAATAATDASAAAGTGRLPEIRVRSIKPIAGSCP